MVPGTKFGFCSVVDRLVQQVVNFFEGREYLFASLKDTAAVQDFVKDGGFGYPAGKVLIVDAALLNDAETIGFVKEALTDTTFHIVALERTEGELEDQVLREYSNFHSVDVASDDVISDLTHHLYDIKRSIEFIWLNAKVSDILGNYEAAYVSESNHTKRIQQFIDRLGKVLNADSINLYMLDGSLENFQIRYQFGSADDGRIPKALLEEDFEFCDTCSTYRVSPILRNKFSFLGPEKQEFQVIVSTFQLSEVPGCVIFLLDPQYDGILMRELCAVGARELFHLLRVKLVGSQYDCLKKLTEISNIDASKRDVLWKVLEHLKDHFQVSGVSIVEQVVDDDGTKSFEKTYIHNNFPDFDKFPEKETFVQYCVSTGKGLIINQTDIKAKYGVGFAFDPDLINPALGEPVQLNTLVAPKGSENEASLMFFPLKQNERVLGAIKLGDFERSCAFDLHQLQSLSIFADPVVVLIDNIQRIQDLKARAQSNLERGQFAQDAEALFFYREIALGVFHQATNHLNNLFSTLQKTEMKAEAPQTKMSEVRELLGRLIILARHAKEVIATAQTRGKTLKPIEQQCYLIEDILRPAFQYAKKKMDDFGAKGHLKHAFTDKDYLVHLDKELIKESIINILNNAIWAVKAHKTTTKHQVFMGVRELTDEKKVRIEVTDSGIGIDQESFPQLFTPFFTTRSSEGTGLGLYFARKIVEEFGGAISIPRSHPGKGTTVEIIIPFQEAKQV